ncbi:MAG: glycosyltransferase [Candidatus Omnitrophica bacterium]|nr:glycosyltransferase [Candidatus Omnitrophota bacterium]
MTNNTPKISIVIAAYNHGRYIDQTIKSVLAQTFRDFEVIVIDDGSKDDTRNIVNAIKDERIRYVYQENSGLPACARNKGMSMARGEYISLLDGDDYWHKEKLFRSKVILDNDETVGLVCHNEHVLYNDKILRTTSYGPYVDDMYLKLLLVGNCLHTSAITMRRNIFFEDACRFCEDKALFTIEDYEYWLRLSRKYRFHFIPDVLGYYRVTETGAFLSAGGSNAINMLRLLDSNFGQIKDPDNHTRSMMNKRRSSVMCAAGRACHHKGDFKHAMKWYVEAFKENRLNYKAYIGLAAAIFRLRILYK